MAADRGTSQHHAMSEAALRNAKVLCDRKLGTCNDYQVETEQEAADGRDKTDENNVSVDHYEGEGMFSMSSRPDAE